MHLNCKRLFMEGLLRLAFMRSVSHEVSMCANFVNKNENKTIFSANNLQTMENAFKLGLFAFSVNNSSSSSSTIKTSQTKLENRSDNIRCQRIALTHFYRMSQFIHIIWELLNRNMETSAPKLNYGHDKSVNYAHFDALHLNTSFISFRLIWIHMCLHFWFIKFILHPLHASIHHFHGKHPVCHSSIHTHARTHAHVCMHTLMLSFLI